MKPFTTITAALVPLIVVVLGAPAAVHAQAPAPEALAKQLQTPPPLGRAFRFVQIAEMTESLSAAKDAAPKITEKRKERLEVLYTADGRWRVETSEVTSGVGAAEQTNRRTIVNNGKEYLVLQFETDEEPEYRFYRSHADKYRRASDALAAQAVHSSARGLMLTVANGVEKFGATVTGPEAVDGQKAWKLAGKAELPGEPAPLNTTTWISVDQPGLVYRIVVSDAEGEPAAELNAVGMLPAANGASVPKGYVLKRRHRAPQGVRTREIRSSLEKLDVGVEVPAAQFELTPPKGAMLTDDITGEEVRPPRRKLAPGTATAPTPPATKAPPSAPRGSGHAVAPERSEVLTAGDPT